MATKFNYLPALLLRTVGSRPTKNTVAIAAVFCVASVTSCVHGARPSSVATTLDSVNLSSPAIAIANDAVTLFSLERDGQVTARALHQPDAQPRWQAASADPTLVWRALAISHKLLFVAGDREAATTAGVLASIVIHQIESGERYKELDAIGTGTVAISAVVAAPAPANNDAIVVGWFTETMRLGDFTLASAGGRDGFFARIGGDGTVRWAYRVGGNDDDALVAAASDPRRAELALAGSFVRSADWRGQTLRAPIDDSNSSNGVVATIDGNGTLRWASVFGGPKQVALAGVALLPDGRVAVAATGRDEVHWPGKTLSVSGPSDGVLGWYGADGALLGAATIGGADFDGLTGIAAIADATVAVAGWCSGTCTLGTTTVRGTDGTAAFVAQLGFNQAPRFATVLASPGHEWVGSIAVDVITKQWTALARALGPMTIDGRISTSNTVLLHSGNK